MIKKPHDLPDQTWYQATLDQPFQAEPLNGQQQASVLIIGAGLAGLTTAVGLAEQGLDGVCLLEAGEIGAGASGRNGGFVFGGYSLSEAALLKQLEPEQARSLYQLTEAACGRIRQRAAHYGIECEINPSGVVLANCFSGIQRLQQQQLMMREQFGAQWPMLAPEDLRQQLKSDFYHGGLLQPEAFHFHPLKFCHGMARAAQQQGVQIFTQSPVRRLQRVNGLWQAETADGVVEAERVLVACGGYFDKFLPRLARAVMPIATYVMVTEPLGNRLDEVMTRRAAVYDNRFAFDYYRPLSDTRLMWGGRISIRERTPQQVARVLAGDMCRIYPQLADVAVDYAWSGRMSYAWHQMPQIGQAEPGLWYAMGFGGHGMATTALAGDLLAAALAEGDVAWQAFQRWGVRPVGGRPARWLAQFGYWYFQCRDWLAMPRR